MNKLLCYVAAVSRKMASPLSVMIQSRSAAGKSYLQDTVLSLVPKEDCTKYTRLTQALFYKVQTMEFKYKTIEYINVTLDDIEKANTIANYVLGRSLDELSPSSRKLLMLVKQMCKEKAGLFYYGYIIENFLGNYLPCITIYCPVILV